MKHYLAPLERGSRRERIRSGRGLPLSGPKVRWRNDWITCEPQRRPPEATGVVLDEQTFQTHKLSRNANGKSGWDPFGVSYTPGGAFGSRLGGVLHGEKRGFRFLSLI